MTDLEFVRQCANGDKQSWDYFLKQYSRLIYSYIYSILKTNNYILNQENVDDLFQEIFVSLIKDDFRKLKSFKAKNGCSLASWLRQITINFTIDYLRKQKPGASLDAETGEGLSLLDMLTGSLNSARESLVKEENLASLKDCIENLALDDKYFLELHFNQGLRLEDLREHFKQSRGAIDMRKARIVDRLQECFKSKGFALDF